VSVLDTVIRQRRWTTTDKYARKLNRAVSAFRSSGRRNRDLDTDDSSSDSDEVDDDKSRDPSASISDTAFRQELQEAIEFYNRGIKKQSPVLGSLRVIRVNMNPFLSWIAGLRGDGHRSSVLCMYNVLPRGCESIKTLTAPHRKDAAKSIIEVIKMDPQCSSIFHLTDTRY